MKKFITLLAFLSSSIPFVAQELDYNRTLRVDYIFSGDAMKQEISVSELTSFPGWAGRRCRMDSVPLAGNGDIVMRDVHTGTILYRQSFSTLFQEWLNTEEAQHTRKAFENVFLLPMPKDSVLLSVELRGNHNAVLTRFSHYVYPQDILIRRMDGRNVAPHQYIHRGGDSQSCIDVAIVAEGYTVAEKDRFYARAQEAVEAIFSHAPFGKYKENFNFVAIALPSQESGVSIPGQDLWVETALGSHFDTFYSDRYLTTLNLRRLHDALYGIPYEHIIILANTENYGGGGIYNSYTLTAADHRDFRPVVVHEFGHSFAGLADEYFYDDQYNEFYYPDAEPWEQNLTTLYDFDSKWADMLQPGTLIPTPVEAGREGRVGVYEGGGYQSKGVFRPCLECRMKINNWPEFCPVCQRAIERLINFYTN